MRDSHAVSIYYLAQENLTDGLLNCLR